MYWNLRAKKQRNIVKKALYALKILDIISQRHKDVFDFGKDKNININKFLQRIYNIKTKEEDLYITGCLNCFLMLIILRLFDKIVPKSDI
jgi:hypothetical protein